MFARKVLAAAALGAGLVMATSVDAATIVNISASNQIGATVSLAAGTYTINLIGTAQGGAYSGWSPWNANAGCDVGGSNCSQGYKDDFAIDFGHGVGNFDRVDGTNYTDGQLWATDLQALAAFQAGPISGALLPVATLGPGNPVAYPITFTLASAQDVKFFAMDSAYADNRGGISLQLTTPTTPTTAVPEPAGWAMMLVGFGGLGAAIRGRRRKPAAVAA